MRHRSHPGYQLVWVLFYLTTTMFAQSPPPVSFLTAVSYAAGSRPYSVGVGDFNGDGKPDLAVVNGGSSNVSVLLGNGDGTFQAAVNYSALSNPYSVAVGDFNGDGKPDLAVVNGGSSSVSVLLGNGDGTFQAAVSYAAGIVPVSIAVVDFNGDGKPDLAVANEGSNSVSVLLGNGDGTFQAAVNYSVGSYPYSVATGDFNGDGKPDLVVANATSNNVSVLLGNGDGTFRAAVNYAAGSQPSSVAVSDFNGDGKPDLAVVNERSNSVSVLLGNGDGTFRAAVNYAAGSQPSSVAVGDFNGDGKPDLAVANVGSGSVSVLLGKGDGTFQLAVNYGTGTNPLSIGVGDFNSDGKPDLAVANNGSNSMSVLLNNTKAATSTALTSSSNPSLSGQSVTFTATVSSASGIPTGAVSLKKGTTTLGTSNLTNGSATFSISSLTPGPNTITAVYGAEANFLGSTSAALTQTVNKITTTTTITSSLNPSILGQMVTFTATVSSTFGPPPNGEAVTFTKGTTTLAVVALSGGSANFSTSSLPSGTFTISASYAGDSQFAASSRGVYQTVKKIPTTTSIFTSLNPSTFGQSVTVTAQVSSNAGTPPDGETVNFTAGGVVIGTGTLSAGVAKFATSTLGGGPHPITATYVGDASFAASSALLMQTVNRSATTAVVASLGSPSSIGSAVVFTATVTSSTGVIPMGTMTFKDGVTTLGTGTLDGTGTATFSTSALAGGSHTITAAFVANSNFLASTSAAIIQNVFIPGGINFSNVSHATTGSPTTTTATVPAIINQGDTVIVVVALDGYAFPAVSSLVDSANNPGYVQLGTAVYTDQAQVFIWGAINVPNAASQVTITLSKPMPDIGVEVATYTGVSSFENTATKTTTSNQPNVAVTTQEANNFVVMGVAQQVCCTTTYSANIGGLRDFGSIVTPLPVNTSLGFAINDNSATSATSVINKVTSTGSGNWAVAAVELRGPP